MVKQNSILLCLLVFIILAFIVTGIAVDGAGAVLKGFVSLQLRPARLINDFVDVSGTGAALFNSAMVGIVALGLILLTRVQLSGPTFAAVFTIMGFGLFGKTVLNILPILFGVFLSAKFMRKTFREYLIIALFGTALGPLVSLFAFELGLSVPLAAGLSVLAGTATGFFLPAIAVSMLHLHQGYNLYNMGLSCGFFGLFAAALIKAAGHGLEGALFWFTGDSAVLTLLVPVLSFILIAAGLVTGKKQSLKDLMAIQKHPGRLPSDFMDMESMAGTLINCGLIGLVGSAYILVIGADFNGPVIGGLLTIMGFGAFGTHLKNAWPVILGVIVSTLLFGWSLNSPGPVLAAIFCTTLAPLAGQFGILTGFLAGFIHLVMVMQTGSWHGAMNLYNNGFAGGLTAALIVSVIQWYRSNRME